MLTLDTCSLFSGRYANHSSTLELRVKDVFGNAVLRGGADWLVRVALEGTYSHSPLRPTVLKLAAQV